MTLIDIRFNLILSVKSEIYNFNGKLFIRRFMYGYVNINKMELRLKEIYEFQGFYCGLCETLGERYGVSGRFSLSYDMTFLIVLLTSLYEPDSVIVSKHCPVHPLRKKPVITNKFSEYAADMNIILAYEHFADDYKDEKKLKAAAGLLAYKNAYKRAVAIYERQTKVIKEELDNLSRIEEAEDDDIEKAAATFGKIMAEIFVYEKDNWEEDLRRIGFFIGKFIYIMDAYEDVEEDIKKGNYNPFKKIYKEKGFKENVKYMLEMTISECAAAFERLPLIKDVDILRNILYDGVWTKFDRRSENESL